MDKPDLIYKALSEPLRLRILDFLKRPDAACCSVEDRVCACDLEGLLGLSQPTISHHMKILVQAGLVSSEKSGRWVYYRVNRPIFAAAAAHLMSFSDGEPALPIGMAAEGVSKRAAAKVN